MLKKLFERFQSDSASDIKLDKEKIVVSLCSLFISIIIIVLITLFSKEDSLSTFTASIFSLVIVFSISFLMTPSIIRAYMKYGRDKQNEGDFTTEIIRIPADTLARIHFISRGFWGLSLFFLFLGILNIIFHISNILGVIILIISILVIRSFVENKANLSAYLALLFAGIAIVITLTFKVINVINGSHIFTDLFALYPVNFALLSGIFGATSIVISEWSLIKSKLISLGLKNVYAGVTGLVSSIIGFWMYSSSKLIFDVTRMPPSSFAYSLSVNISILHTIITLILLIYLASFFYLISNIHIVKSSVKSIFLPHTPDRLVLIGRWCGILLFLSIYWPFILRGFLNENTDKIMDKFVIYAGASPNGTHDIFEFKQGGNIIHTTKKTCQNLDFDAWIFFSDKKDDDVVWVRIKGNQLFNFNPEAKKNDLLDEHYTYFKTKCELPSPSQSAQ